LIYEQIHAFRMHQFKEVELLFEWSYGKTLNTPPPHQKKTQKKKKRVKH